MIGQIIFSDVDFGDFQEQMGSQVNLSSKTRHLQDCDTVSREFCTKNSGERHDLQKQMRLVKASHGLQ